MSDKMYYRIRWTKKDGTAEGKCLFRDAGFSYNDAKTWAMCILETMPGVKSITIELFDGMELLFEDVYYEED